MIRRLPLRLVILRSSVVVSIVVKEVGIVRCHHVVYLMNVRFEVIGAESYSRNEATSRVVAMRAISLVL